MTAKEYLSQAKYLDTRINSKIEQIESLNDLATRCTPVLTGMPHNPSGTTSRLEDAIVKIVDYQNELVEDMNRLVELKKEIADVISKVPNQEQQIILEKRYLLQLPWEQIAVDLFISNPHVFRKHDAAIEAVEKIMRVKERE